MSGAWEYLATALDMIKCISNAIYEFISVCKIFYRKTISAAEQAPSRWRHGCLSFVCCSGRLQSEDHVSRPAQPPLFL
jgi:hypothetical protein